MELFKSPKHKSHFSTWPHQNWWDFGQYLPWVFAITEKDKYLVYGKLWYLWWSYNQFNKQNHSGMLLHSQTCNLQVIFWNLLSWFDKKVYTCMMIIFGLVSYKVSLFALCSTHTLYLSYTVIANAILAFYYNFFCDWEMPKHHWKECHSHLRVLIVIYHYTFMLDSYIHNFHRSVFNHILTRSNVQTFLKKYR